MLDAYTPAQLSAFWAGVTGTVALITGSVAVLTLLSVRADSKARSRPLVSAELLPIVLAKGTTELVIKNVGASVAKNVTVSFDPPITEDIGELTAYLARRYSQPIPTLGPGLRLTNIYAHREGPGTDDLREPVPQDITVAISYGDGRGHTYEDSYELSLRTLRNESTTTPSNTDEAGMRRREVRALEAIARGLHR